MLRKRVALPALLAGLLLSCRADDSTANGGANELLIAVDAGRPKSSDRGWIIELSRARMVEKTKA